MIHVTQPCSHSPGRHTEVFLDEVAGDGQRQEGEQEHRGHVGNDTQGGDTQQGGAGEALQGGRDVLVDCVCVGGEPVEDAAERSRFKQPGGVKAVSQCFRRLIQDIHLFHVNLNIMVPQSHSSNMDLPEFFENEFLQMTDSDNLFHL